MDKAMVSAYRFFRAHAGYCVGFSAQGALALARAERAAELAGASYEWTPDGDADTSWMDERARKSCEYAEGCILRDNAGNVLASLWGIWDADKWHARVVQAELALEAMDALVAYAEAI